MRNIAALNVESCCAPRAPRLPKFIHIYTRSEIHIFSFISFTLRFVVQFDIAGHSPSRSDRNKTFFVRFKFSSTHAWVRF